MYMLAENPEIVKRLRDEVIATVGLERCPTYEDLRSMKYLRAFVNGAVYSSTVYLPSDLILIY